MVNLIQEGTIAVSVLSLHTSDSSVEMGLMDNWGLAICPQDSRFSFSDGRWRDDILCLLHFSSPGNSVELPVVGGPDWKGLNHWQGNVWAGTTSWDKYRQLPSLCGVFPLF